MFEKNSFEFDYFRFITAYQNYFYYGGHLIDVEITNDKMKNFLEEEKPLFEKLAYQYIQKILSKNTN